MISVASAKLLMLDWDHVKNSLCAHQSWCWSTTVLRELVTKRSLGQ